ncbi:cholesterol 24-hydroxylase-like [Dendronephthya gigantea]|uniref:cholesterol 24-hydroxylase-like n=1 Tax=Dendronephthya gigantea TaxID=151771 RepID=UPI001069FFAA|nr:cholesterol 24-hydroxylase-like [Dendronephthya gigantea]
MADSSMLLALVLQLLFVCLIALFLGFTLYIYYMHYKLSHIPGPPRGNFFFGNLLEIRRRRLVEGKNIHQTLADWSTEYRPVFVIWFFHVPLTVVSDADVVRDVLVVKNLPKDHFGYARFQFVYGQRFLGYGLFTDLNRLTWEAKRRTFTPLFHQKKVYEAFPTLNACCENFLERLETYADGKTEISLADEFLLVTLETILKWSCDLEMKNDEDRLAFEVNFKNALRGISLSFQSPATKYNLWSSLKLKCTEGARLTRETAKSVVEMRQRDIDAGNQTPEDALSYVFKLKETLPNWNIEDLVDMLVTVVFGGMDTTGNNLCFTALSIGLNPDVEKRLRKEIDSTFGEGEEIRAQDIMSMSYLTQVVKESLRLHPPTPALTRRTEKDTVIGGIMIPGDTPIMVNPYVIQTHPDYWEDPSEFKPERFSSDAKLYPHAYFPFSLGPRRCIASQLADLQVKLVIARLLKRFKFELLPGQTLEIAENISFGPIGTVRCKLSLV